MTNPYATSEVTDVELKQGTCPCAWRLLSLAGNVMRSWQCSLSEPHYEHKVIRSDGVPLFYWAGDGHADVKFRAGGR